MYPKVKVRELDDPIAIQEVATSNFIRVIESLSIEAHPSPRIMPAKHGTECKNDPQPHAKISKSYPRNVLTPSISTSKGKNNEATDDGNRTIIRACSVPRPRAVLSSPDNDGMIGNQNQLIRKREIHLKRQNQNMHAHDTERITGKQNRQIRESGTPSRSRSLGQNTHAQVKAAQRDTTIYAPLRVVALESSRSTHPKEKHTSELSKPRQRPPAINGG